MSSLFILACEQLNAEGGISLDAANGVDSGSKAEGNIGGAIAISLA
jgi:hypothetical protein